MCAQECEAGRNKNKVTKLGNDDREKKRTKNRMA